MKIFSNAVLTAATLLVVIVAVVPVASMPADDFTTDDSFVMDTSPDLELSGQIIVGFAIDSNNSHKDRASRRAQASNFVSETLARVRDETGLSDCNTEVVYESISDKGGFDVFDVGQGNEQVIMEALIDADSEDLIAYVQPDYIVHTVAVPNDQFLAFQYHHGVMSMFDAWDISTGSPSVTIGVCDTGLDLDHPDLDNQLEHYNAITQEWGEDIATTAFDNPHGTIVAGAAAAIGNNAIGVAGAGWDFKHRHGQVSTSVGRSRSSIIADCIQNLCRKSDVKVVNVSWSGVYDHARHVVAEECRNEYDTLVVNAAGNSNAEVVGDADLDSIIFVGATDENDIKASFSNFGTLVDVWAPGVGIGTTTEDGQYIGISGTSLSAPLIAGVIGLIRSVDPELTSDEVEAILKQSSDKFASLDGLGGNGRVNAYEALRLAAGESSLDPTPPPVCDEELEIEIVTDDYPFANIAIQEIVVIDEDTGATEYENIWLRQLLDAIECYTPTTLKVPGLCKDTRYAIEFFDFVFDGWEGGTCSNAAQALSYFPEYTCSNDYEAPFLRGTWNDKTLFHLSDLSGTRAQIDFTLRDCTGAGGKSTKSPKRRVRKNRIRKN